MKASFGLSLRCCRLFHCTKHFLCASFCSWLNKTVQLRYVSLLYKGFSRGESGSLWLIVVNKLVKAVVWPCSDVCLGSGNEQGFVCDSVHYLNPVTRLRPASLGSRVLVPRTRSSFPGLFRPAPPLGSGCWSDPRLLLLPEFSDLQKVRFPSRHAPSSCIHRPSFLSNRPEVTFGSR